MPLYLSLYAIGMLLGLAANIALDVPLQRPGLRQGIGLILFCFLLWAVLSVTHTQLQPLLLPLVWAGTGVLVGLGSRESRAAS